METIPPPPRPPQRLHCVLGEDRQYPFNSPGIEGNRWKVRNFRLECDGQGDLGPKLLHHSLAMLREVTKGQRAKVIPREIPQGLNDRGQAPPRDVEAVEEIGKVPAQVLTFPLGKRQGRPLGNPQCPQGVAKWVNVVDEDVEGVIELVGKASDESLERSMVSYGGEGPLPAAKRSLRIESQLDLPGDGTGHHTGHQCRGPSGNECLGDPQHSRERCSRGNGKPHHDQRAKHQIADQQECRPRQHPRTAPHRRPATSARRPWDHSAT